LRKWARRWPGSAFVSDRRRPRLQTRTVQINQTLAYKRKRAISAVPQTGGSVSLKPPSKRPHHWARLCSGDALVFVSIVIGFENPGRAPPVAPSRCTRKRVVPYGSSRPITWPYSSPFFPVARGKFMARDVSSWAASLCSP
jgi:hypothetical protein